MKALRVSNRILFVYVLFAITLALLTPSAIAQQTLGSIDGTVTDSSGAVIQRATVKARAVATNLQVSAATKGDGSFNIADLPIGTYEVTFTKDGFQTKVFPQILVQGSRTATIRAQLSPGHTSETVTVSATPLLNSTDTTTGYTLDDRQIAEIPLGTGSFTQAAILSPGVSADFLNTAGTNAGLGNQAIWSNGQRDTSNSFTLNGVSGDNIFNGKSTSQVTSSRVAVNIGENGNGNNPSGQIVTSTSVYGAIGQALPSPPPETIEELHVNSAMYDASQGSNSGAHIELTTKSGTNAFHGGAYEYYQTKAFDANDWFFGHNSLQTPSLQRNVFGAYVGGPIIKDKLFFFGSYQGQRVHDELLGDSLVAVPPDLTNARDAASIANAVNKDFGTSITPGQITPQALALLQAKAPNGSYFIPSASPNFAILQQQFADTIVLGPESYFKADQFNANIDYNFSVKDRLSTKYYYQNDPNTTPFAESELLGFPQTMQAGSQTLSLDNTTALSPNLTWEQRFGFVREKAYSATTGFLNASDVGMNLVGLSQFPSVSIRRADNSANVDSLSIGPTNNFANAGMFQNNFEWASNLRWVHGRHSLSTGFNFDYTQLNIINKEDDTARVTFADFPGFLLGQICGPNAAPAIAKNCGGQDASEVLNGASNRYYRSKQVGVYAQDDIKIKPNLMVDIGMRWDWDGPLYEKNGFLTNFYPQDYSYDVATDTVKNIGLVVAGNNPVFGTKGVSASTLTGRQWGFAPRIGLSYSPSFAKNVVVRAGFGMYYDRGEYFAELSPPAGGGISGPFGVTVDEPFVVPSYEVKNATFAAPFGTSPPAPPPANLSSVQALVPNAAQLIANTTNFCNNTNQTGCGPLFFGGYDPRNTIPYSENWTLDLQWQPTNTLVAHIGYVGNHGVHETIPLPFNQAQIATPQHPLLAGGPFVQTSSYGYNATPGENIFTLVDGFATGNAALRAPYLGYDPNSVFTRTVGESNYDALQVNVNKRISHGLQITGSYTYSHTLDEQSGLGLFFSGNDPNNPHSSYGTSDFDRTHVFTVQYHYEFPTSANASGWLKQIVNGWGINGLTVYQSGQPYSVIDFSGGAGSIYWGGGQDAITNPIVPVGGLGSTSANPILQGTTGVNGNKPVLNAAAFGIPPIIPPGTDGVPAGDFYETGYASGGRNIFRSPFQERYDFGVFKNFKLKEGISLRYDVTAFNIFNHPSFDIPSNDVEFNPFFSNPPTYGFSGFPACVPSTGAYTCPPSGNLGVLQHTIGSSRFMQMALHLEF
jgi:hypothetical protein